MRKNSLTLVILASAAYFFALYAAGSLVPQGSTTPLYFLAGPLVVLILILASDLYDRATVPKEERSTNPPSRKLAREITELSRQIEVGSTASPEYFENVLLARLRLLLIGKVSLETGLDPERVREILGNDRLGPGLLKDDELYRLLYSRPPVKGPLRTSTLENAVARIENWKL